MEVCGKHDLVYKLYTKKYTWSAIVQYNESSLTYMAIILVQMNQADLDFCEVENYVTVWQGNKYIYIQSPCIFFFSQKIAELRIWHTQTLTAEEDSITELLTETLLFWNNKILVTLLYWQLKCHLMSTSFNDVPI